MKHKYETRQHVIDFIKMIEVQHNSHVKTVRSDNGIEFLMPQFYSSKGIIHQTSCVETPEQNGRVERKHQHLLNVGRALLFQANLPKIFWSYVVQHATYIINRIPSSVLKNKSPYELMHHEQPKIENLKVFGSLAYASTQTAHRSKLDPRARKCLFLGHKPGVKGAVLFDLHSKTIFLSRNVTHHDHILPYKSSPNQPSWEYHTETITTAPLPDTTSDIIDTISTSSSPIDSLPIQSESISDISSPTAITYDTSPQEPQIDPDSSPNEAIDLVTTTPAIHPTSQRPIRDKHLPSYLSDYVCNQSSTSSVTTSSGSLYHISDYHSFAHLSKRVLLRPSQRSWSVG
jgi:hypothetical protein